MFLQNLDYKHLFANIDYREGGSSFYFITQNRVEWAFNIGYRRIEDTYLLAAKEKKRHASHRLTRNAILTLVLLQKLKQPACTTIQ